MTTPVSEDAFAAHVSVSDYKFDDIKKDIGRVEDRCDQIDRRIIKMDEKYDTLFELVSSLRTLSANIDAVGNQLQSTSVDISKKQETLSQHIDDINAKLREHDNKFDEFKYSSMKQTHSLQYYYLLLF